MTVAIDGEVIRLEGRCRVEDAEALLAALHDNPRRIVDLDRCATLHTALVQLIMAASPRLQGTPMDASLRRWLLPLLETAGGPFEPISVGL